MFWQNIARSTWVLENFFVCTLALGPQAAVADFPNDNLGDCALLRELDCAACPSECTLLQFIKKLVQGTMFLSAL